jgi:Abnormal spindle-like microcephaly-assoc'd, ASPM-SPD-2-Hydin/Fibronectin type III domain
LNVDIEYGPENHGGWKIWKALFVFVILLAAVMSNSDSAQAVSCAYSSGSWANTTLAQSQGSTFRIAYDATASSSSANAISGLSSGSANEYTDLATGVRFNPSGMLDVRNGSGFTAAASVAYRAGVTYHFILDVNVSNHTYNAYVVLGSGQITLGSNLAFRTEQRSVSALNDVGVMSSAGALGVCNVTLSSSTTVSGSSSTLSANVSSLNFGNTGLASSKQLSVTLTNTGSSSVTVSGVSVSGAGFTATGSASGLTVSAGKSISVPGTFTPFAIGTVSGKLTISSNAKNSPASIALSGTGVASSTHSVALSWNASSSAVAGYNVYVSSSSGGPYSLVNTSPVPSTNYVDTNVQAGATYHFYITSVSSSYQESSPSASVQASVP